jgi:hypothetical protein
MHYLAQFFEFRHLPPHLQEIAQPFAVLVQKILTTLPDNPERTTALRKMLEARDCSLRASIFKATE